MPTTHRKWDDIERGDFLNVLSLFPDRQYKRMATVDSVTRISDAPHRMFITLTVAVDPNDYVETYR